MFNYLVWIFHIYVRIFLFVLEILYIFDYSIWNILCIYMGCLFLSWRFPDD